MPRTGQAALDWCAAQVKHPSRDWFGYCLIFSRQAFEVAAKHPDAATAWKNTAFKHGTTGTPPAAVPVWWTGGSHGYGHVAVSAGDGYCYSSDILHKSKIDRVKISLISQKWGLPYKGWTEDINGVKVYKLPAPFVNLPAVDLSDVQTSLGSDKPLPKNLESQFPGLLRVERALQAEGLLPDAKPTDGFMGAAWRQGYALWQKRSGVGGPYDGIPGVVSLTRLGSKHGFKVVP